MIDLADLEPFGDDRLRRLAAYWFHIRGSRIAPRRCDIDAAQIYWALPIIWLCDFIPEQRRFRYRLAGEEINKMFGFSLRGKFLDEIMRPDALAVPLERNRRVVTEPAIAHCRGAVYLHHGKTVLGERVVLPLSEDGVQGTGLFGATVYEWNREDQTDHFATERVIDAKILPLREPARTMPPLDAMPPGMLGGEALSLRPAGPVSLHHMEHRR
jgi:hypothetical protein